MAARQMISWALCTIAGATIAAGAAAAPSTPVPALDHVAINAADQQRSIDFYKDAFGLKEIPTPFPPGGPRWLALAGGMALHIQHLPERIAPAPRAVHFAIAVPDLGGVIAYFDRHKIAWTDSSGRAGKVQDIRSDKVQQIYVQDPDGHWVEVNDKLKVAANPTAH